MESIESIKSKDKIWLSRYPQGIPAEIKLGEFKSLVEMINQTCDRFSTRIAFSNLGFGLSFADIRKKSDQMAAFYQNELGLKKGDRIAIQMPNLLQYPIALFGALKAGLVVVNTNPLYTPDEMKSYFIDSGAETIVILENFADKLEKIIDQTAIKNVILTEIGDLLPTPKRLVTNWVVKYVKKMVPQHTLRNRKTTISFQQALKKGATSQFSPPEIQSKDLAFLQYTGGTTGVSKAAMLTHQNLLANLSQMLTWMSPQLKEGTEIVIAALPLYHVFCLTVNCFGLFHIGSQNVLITNPRDIPGFIKTLAETKPTVITAVSTLLGGLMNNSHFSELDLSSLKVTVAGGMALKGSVAKEWKARTRTSVIEGYGLTEASPVVSCNPLDGTDRLGTIGLPLPSTDIRIAEDGELCVKGPQVMQGYWNKPEETEKVIDSEGWLHTGDMAVFEADGFLKIIDRKKDMILVSGFNVYPNEVEEVVMHHPKVLEAAAIGVPDDHSGEAVKLFVVKKDPSLTAEELKAFCRERLTGYKRPREIEFRSDLPKTNVGKVLRRELKK